ncbi:hypothetical protein FKW77_004351 [Venturia effusa]|uniref:Major facilitator superfamily (MFS) profile domain-containing protein n=1 Tax=Venturia effusa TaxID=50376 RepID=A0A517LLB5_9PEZI|nr:hypothetical protein FKW77_004351 [Venturia effusa]
MLVLVYPQRISRSLVSRSFPVVVDIVSEYFTMDIKTEEASQASYVEDMEAQTLSKFQKEQRDEDIDRIDTCIAAEHAGTILGHKDDGRRTNLHPMPSLDPNDPLNWPRSKKYMTYLTICFFSFLATVNVSKFSIAVVVLSKEFHVSSTEAGYLVSFGVLMLGMGNLFWVVMLRIIGRRPAFLLAIPLLFVTNIWAYFSGSFGSLLASTIVGGFGAAAAEAPVSAVVADMFFVNERGAMLMIFHLALSFGFFVGPFLNAYVLQYAGWRWICGWLAIASGLCWLVALFTIHETVYRDRDVSAPAERFGGLRPFKWWLNVTSGYDRRIGFLRTAWNMIAVVGYPSVTWAGLVIGGFVGWNVVVQQEAARTFTTAPYHWKAHSLGLLSLSGLIGALVATFLGGRLVDIVSNHMTKKNHGRREPEFRLPTIVLPAIIGPMGILIFGICVANKLSWGGAAVGYGMQGFGLTAAPNILVTYAVDSYLPLAGEALVVVFVLRGIASCLLSIFAPNWIEDVGTTAAFGQMVGVQYFLLIFVVLFAFYGKRIRAMTARSMKQNRDRQINVLFASGKILP